jgi:hypothetical protein
MMNRMQIRFTSFLKMGMERVIILAALRRTLTTIIPTLREESFLGTLKGGLSFITTQHECVRNV